MGTLKNVSTEDILTELKQRVQDHEFCKSQVKDLELSLREVNEKLADSEAMKSHFISNISNELINPFTSVLAISENILGVEKENWKKVIHMVSLIHTEVFNLDFQLKNIIAAARLEAGEIQPEISLVNIDQLIKNVIQVFKYEARRKQLRINYKSSNQVESSPIFFKSDASKIHLILSNLLSNAIKFSYSEGEVHIVAVKQESRLTLEVTDRGHGISKANEQIIFDRFRRLDSGINSLNRGHGLGLSIIKAIIDMLEGKIEFVSNPGEGTTFKVVLFESTENSAGVSTDADEIFFKEEKF